MYSQICINYFTTLIMTIYHLLVIIIMLALLTLTMPLYHTTLRTLSAEINQAIDLPTRQAWLLTAISLLCNIILFINLASNIKMMLASIFTQGLIVASIIDHKHGLLPDAITLSLMWIGLLANSYNLFCTAHAAIIGSICGYLSLYITNRLYYFYRKKEGIGHGDFKLLAASGALLGYQSLPNIIIIACLLTLSLSCIQIVRKQKTAGASIAFGPGLSVASFLVLLHTQ